MKFLRFDFIKIKKEIKKINWIQLKMEFTAYAALRASESPHPRVFLLVVYI